MLRARWRNTTTKTSSIKRCSLVFRVRFCLLEWPSSSSSSSFYCIASAYECVGGYRMHCFKKKIWCFVRALQVDPIITPLLLSASVWRRPQSPISLRTPSKPRWTLRHCANFYWRTSFTWLSAAARPACWPSIWRNHRWTPWLLKHSSTSSRYLPTDSWFLAIYLLTRQMDCSWAHKPWQPEGWRKLNSNRWVNSWWEVCRSYLRWWRGTPKNRRSSNTSRSKPKRTNRLKVWRRKFKSSAPSSLFRGSLALTFDEAVWHTTASRDQFLAVGVLL